MERPEALAVVQHIAQLARFPKMRTVCEGVESNPVDGDVDTGLHPLIALPCTPAAYQFDLQMVQRVDVGKSGA